MSEKSLNTELQSSYFDDQRKNIIGNFSSERLKSKLAQLRVVNLSQSKYNFMWGKEKKKFDQMRDTKEEEEEGNIKIKSYLRQK